jgi:hypothetical protein
MQAATSSRAERIVLAAIHSSLSSYTLRETCELRPRRDERTAYKKPTHYGSESRNMPVTGGASIYWRHLADLAASFRGEPAAHSGFRVLSVGGWLPVEHLVTFLCSVYFS